MVVLACAELPPSVAKHPPDYTLSTTTWLYDNDDRTTDQSQFCRQYQHVQILDPYSEIGQCICCAKCCAKSAVILRARLDSEPFLGWTIARIDACVRTNASSQAGFGASNQINDPSKELSLTWLSGSQTASHNVVHYVVDCLDFMMI